ncbi:hypothetical protein OEA41_002157 [Lepraria neglecta]|uniref:Uncharacterized protein n=1 Tax=Lepraria neglecta TaxID=209136 RepID=A0AAD9ZC40_9LECA|nr:hypothetical protein OEA41_002157 [Lepraria neglecta]
MPIHDPYDPDVILYSDLFEDADENLDFGTVKGATRLELDSQLNPVSIPLQPRKAGMSPKEQACPACAESKKLAELDKKIDSCIACRCSFSQDAITRETPILMTAYKRRRKMYNQNQRGRLHHCRVKIKVLEQWGMGMAGMRVKGTADIWTNASKFNK